MRVRHLLVSLRCARITHTFTVLTSRENGVATVWLVATLGSRSNLKKVNRKAILDVNVPKTCKVIINPEAPMALRLQSNLLRDQLVLEDDPAFLPDMVLPGLNIDLATLDITTDASSHRSSLLSPQSLRTSQSSQQHSDSSMVGLQIPASDEGGFGDLGGFIVPSSDRASIRPSGRFSELRREGGQGIREEDDDFIMDPGFMFDHEGNLIITGDDAQAEQQQPATGRVRSDSAASARVRRELAEGLREGQGELHDLMDVDLNFPRADDEDLILPQAEAFPSMAPQGTGALRSSAAPQDVSSSEESAAAPQRKRREPKTLPYDQTQELRNSVLAQWNADYLTSMEEARKKKTQRKNASSTKQNAALWVSGTGIGGVGIGRGGSNMKGPLAEMFSGDALMAALTGVSTSLAGRKRSRGEDEGDESDAEERRVRMREDGEEIGRAEGLVLDDDDGLVLPGSEAVELPRHALPALDDTSQFPWNRSASLRDSRSRQDSLARGFGSSIAGGFPSSVAGGRPSSLPLPAGSLDRRASRRMTSASPLTGRGPVQERHSDLDIPGFDDDENYLLGGPSTSVAGDDFQLYGPAAGVDTQTAAQSQWMRATLDAESKNFLAFIKAEVAGKAAQEEEGAVTMMTRGVFFEELLPPETNSKIVAAQGLLHTLTLATKGLVQVRQEEDYGAIELVAVE
ncbi:MAG: hypothetical protein LQ350_000811 [Teloschistes chrysophthalmus]|nr:MAG: hypothetical protein LQ350_000811 [Niorma chrysophthalma]